MITGEKIFDLPFYNAKGILTGGDVFGPRYRIAKLTVQNILLILSQIKIIQRFAEMQIRYM